MKELMRKVLNDTIEYYGANPNERRSISDLGACRYRGENGNICAAARLCNPDSIQSLQEGDGWNLEMHEFLKDEYKPLPTDFIYKLQSLHDSRGYWLDFGLSGVGKDFVSIIRKNINENKFE